MLSRLLSGIYYVVERLQQQQTERILKEMAASKQDVLDAIAKEKKDYADQIKAIIVAVQARSGSYDDILAAVNDADMTVQQGTHDVIAGLDAPTTPPVVTPDPVITPDPVVEPAPVVTPDPTPAPPVVS